MSNEEVQALDQQVVVFYLRGEPGSFTEISAAYSDARPGASQEFQGSEGHSISIAGVKCAPRPHNVDRWHQLLDRSWIHQTSVDAKAEDIVGSGYSFDEELSENVKGEISAMLDRSIDQLMDACRDNEGTGFCGLECQPTLGGRELYRLNQIDSWTLWVSIDPREDKQGFMHKRGNKATRFAPLGSFEQDANQLAFLNCKHWRKSTHYGVPDIVPVMIQIETAWHAYTHNFDFFRRGAGYQWMVIIESPTGGSGGMAVPNGAEDNTLIKQINYATREAGKSSSGDILTLPIGNRKAVFQKLSADMKDMDFAGLVNAYASEIRSCHRVAGTRLGIPAAGALGGNLADAEMRAYKKVIDAKQRSWNTLINEVIRAWWGVDAGFAFNPIDIDETALLMPHVVNGFRGMLLSRKEARAMLKQPDVDDGMDLFADEFEMAQSFGPGAVPPEGEA